MSDLIKVSNFSYNRILYMWIRLKGTFHQIRFCAGGTGEAHVIPGAGDCSTPSIAAPGSS